jgi:hypothetical protein
MPWVSRFRLQWEEYQVAYRKFPWNTTEAIPVYRCLMGHPFGEECVRSNPDFKLNQRTTTLPCAAAVIDLEAEANLTL